AILIEQQHETAARTTYAFYALIERSRYAEVRAIRNQRDVRLEPQLRGSACLLGIVDHDTLAKFSKTVGSCDTRFVGAIQHYDDTQ
ncbi:hypothetical protein SB778_42625, partial [Paraburkholderia sp. SIMBA_050]